MSVDDHVSTESSWRTHSHSDTASDAALSGPTLWGRRFSPRNRSWSSPAFLGGKGCHVQYVQMFELCSSGDYKNLHRGAVTLCAECLPFVKRKAVSKEDIAGDMTPPVDLIIERGWRGTACTSTKDPSVQRANRPARVYLLAVLACAIITRSKTLPSEPTLSLCDLRSSWQHGLVCTCQGGNITGRASALSESSSPEPGCCW